MPQILSVDTDRAVDPDEYLSDATVEISATPLPLIAEPQTSDEQRLLQLVAAGDADAFWELWTQHQRALYSICYWQMGGRREDAEDALGDAMQKARETLTREALQVKNLSAWLRRMVVNHCIDLYRRDRGRRRSVYGTDSASPERVARVEAMSRAGPEAKLLASEVRTIVIEAIGVLPLRLQAASTLYFLQEAPYSAIAQNLHISEANARKRIQMARCILKLQLRADLPDSLSFCASAF